MRVLGIWFYAIGGFFLYVNEMIVGVFLFSVEFDPTGLFFVFAFFVGPALILLPLGAFLRRSTNWRFELGLTFAIAGSFGLFVALFFFGILESNQGQAILLAAKTQNDLTKFEYTRIGAASLAVLGIGVAFLLWSRGRSVVAS